MNTRSLFSHPVLNRGLRAGSGIIVIILLALCAPLLTSNNPTVMDIVHRFAAPSWHHPLGTDGLGHDIFAQLLYGARVSLTVAFSSAILATLVGVSIGLLGGYFGGFVEAIALRTTDVVLAFPPILLALLVVTFAGPGAWTLAIVLAVLNAPNFIRITFGEVLTVRRLEYVEAVTALGASNTRIILRTILPNILPPLLVQFSLSVSSVILLESGLSFLGLGVTPPTPSWGLMVQAARGTMTSHPLGLLWPCLALALTVFSVNHFCDVLRQMFDPREARVRKGQTPARRVADAGAAAQADTNAVPSSAGGAESEWLGGGDAPDALSVRNLDVVVRAEGGERLAVQDVSFSIGKGQTVALVGESGSGKSLTSLSIMRLLKSGVRVSGGHVLFPRPDAEKADKQGAGSARKAKGNLPGTSVDLLSLDETRMRQMRGSDLAMVFQEPMTSLNPVYRIGDQIAESLINHRSISKKQARAAALEMLTKVGITDPARRMRQYPHELSGGMRQRVMIALALCCDPALLIADEPTTALDVTLQAEILSLLKKQQNERHGAMSVLFITHNLGVVAQIADRVVVLYAGRVVEEGPTIDIFATPKHPYTKGLISCIPVVGNARDAAGNRARLNAIPGSVPTQLPSGCTFAPRCEMAIDACSVAEPALERVGPHGHASRCIRWREC